MHSIIILASGAGTNAKAIIEYMKTTGKAKVALVVSNKADAGVLDIAVEAHIPYLTVTKETFSEALFIDQLSSYNPGIIILAGFLWKIPARMIDAFPGKIINIHPSLLPAHGGKGMYGGRVHSSVLEKADKESGITIHYVNEHYDAGNIILQARCKVKTEDSVAGLAERIHKLEHYYYPRTIEYLLDNL